MFKSDVLLGKVALVTGGGSGLGKSIVKNYVQYGGVVAILGRRMDVLEKTADEIGGGAVLPIQCNVRYMDEVEHAVKVATEHFGRVDHLVNNAAGNFVSPTEQLSSNAFKLVIDTVLMGTINCTMTLGKAWIKNKESGVILNIVASYASTGSAFVVPSGCAKAGVENLVRSLAAEWGRYNIRSVGIAPGPFPTVGAMTQLAMNKNLIPGVNTLDFIKKRIPLGRLGRKKELADLAVFLLTKNAEFINGDIIRIDGGEMPNIAGEFSFLHDVQSWGEVI